MNGRSEARMLWIDVAKTVGIFLVVFSHLGQSGSTESFLWTFHVPLFFFISGYLTRPRTDREFLSSVMSKLVGSLRHVPQRSRSASTVVTGASQVRFLQT